MSQDPIGFAAGDANLYRYVGNSAGNSRDPAGLEPWNYHYQLWKSQESQQQREKAEQSRRRAQDRLDYLRALLHELIRIGDQLAADQCAGFNIEEWDRIRPHLVYALENYRTIGFFGISLWESDSQNVPGIPGFFLNQDSFYADDVTALTLYVHEPMHDFGRFGIGHAGIDELVGPNEEANVFQRFVDFLKPTKHRSGRSLFYEAHLKCAGQQSAP